MKKLYVLCLLLACAFLANAQLTYEATPEYGKLYDIMYDDSIQNRMYSHTLNNHIMVSNDNGVSWQLMYSVPYTGSSISLMKTVPGGKSLSFVVSGTDTLAQNGLYILQISSRTITRHILQPNVDKLSVINAYGIYDSLATAVIFNTSFSIGLTARSRVYYTPNGGATNRSIYYSEDNETVQVNNVSISPANPRKLYIALGLGRKQKQGGFWKSDNAGKNWTETLTGIPLDPIAINSSDTNNIFVGTAISFGSAQEGIYQSADEGGKWTKANITWSNVTLNNITKIVFDPTNTSTIWALEENEYTISTDGGATWKNTVYPVETPLYYYGTYISTNPYNSNEVAFTSDGFPARSVDKGVTLTQIFNPFYVVGKLSFANYAGTAGLYYGSQSGYLFRNLTADTTRRYDIQSPFIVGAGNYTPIADATVAGRVFLFKVGGFGNSTLYFSADTGATRMAVNGAGSSFDLQVTAFAKDPNNPDVYWMAFYSFGGSNLSKIDVSDPSNPTATSVLLPSSEIAGGICFSPDGNSILLAQGTKVYSSSNGGSDWTEKGSGLEGLSDATDVIKDFHSNPLNASQYIISTNKGIYLSSDGAGSWAPVLSGYDISKAVFSPVTNGHIIAAQYTNLGIQTLLVYSVNGGSEWKEVSPETLDYVRTGNADFSFASSSIDIYFATPDQGIAKYSLTGLQNALPVTLLSFGAALQNGNAVVNWTTGQEQNIRSYVVEHSTDGVHFTQAGTVAAGSRMYQFTDADFGTLATQTGKVYYRLQVISTNGSATYSSIVPLQQLGNITAKLVVYPNPVMNTANIMASVSTTGQYTVSVVDMNGRRVVANQYQLAAGSTSLQIPVANLSKGIYTLILQGANGSRQAIRFEKK